MDSEIESPGNGVDNCSTRGAEPIKHHARDIVHGASRSMVAALGAGALRNREGPIEPGRTAHRSQLGGNPLACLAAVLVAIGS